MHMQADCIRDGRWVPPFLAACGQLDFGQVLDRHYPWQFWRVFSCGLTVPVVVLLAFLGFRVL